MLTKLLSTSIIAGLFLVGCGGDVKNSDEQVELTPHQIDIKPKASRELNPEGEDYLNYMKTYNLNSRIYRMHFIAHNPRHRIGLNDYEHINQDLKYVFYIDSDHDKNTGYYDKWVPNVGADFLVEGRSVYKYTGVEGSHEWSWEYLGGYVGSIDNDWGIQMGYINEHGFTSYGVTLNQDWTYNGFLGYFDDTKTDQEQKAVFDENSNREFTSTKGDTDIYLHAYKKDKQKLDSNEEYYNYNFSVNGQNYYTQGNILFNEVGEVMADNLLYEVRDYDSVTIVPKRYLIDGDIKINKVVIRDGAWNELFSTSQAEPNISMNEKILNDIKDRTGLQNAILIKSEVTSTNKVFVVWRNNEQGNRGRASHLSLYSVDGENISFDKHLVFEDNNTFNITSEGYSGRQISIEKVNNLYELKVWIGGGQPYQYTLLVDSNGDLFYNLDRHANMHNGSPNYIHLGDGYFTTGYLEDNGGLKVINTNTLQISYVPFVDTEPPFATYLTYSSEGNTVVVKWYTHVAGPEGGSWKLISIVKYDASDINNVRLISVENQ